MTRPFEGSTPGARFVAKRFVREFVHQIAAPPDVVFPLLCPVREREWIEGWTSDVVYSRSGVAEKDCIFTTTIKDLGEATYVVSRYESVDHCIEFVVFYPGLCIEKLEIALAGEAEGSTTAKWKRTYTGLSERGNALLERLTGEPFQQRMKGLDQSLNRFCRKNMANPL